MTQTPIETIMGLLLARGTEDSLLAECLILREAENELLVQFLDWYRALSLADGCRDNDELVMAFMRHIHGKG